MQVRVTGRHLDVTPALRDHVEQRLGKLEQIFHNLLDAHAIMFVDGLDHVTDITVTGNHLTLHVRERESDMYAAVDRAVHRLTGQVRKHKERLVNRKKSKLSHGERNLQAAEIAEEELDDVDEGAAAIATGEAPAIVTEQPSGPMTLEEAIELLHTNGDVFYAFTNVDTQQLDVVFLRPDGRIGRITQS